MKRLNPVGIDIKAFPDIDADDMGQRLVECVSSISTDNKVVNVVKIHLGKSIPLYGLENLLKNVIIDPLKEMGAENCIFVPLKEGVIEDVTIDHIEVRKDESNS